VGGDHDGIGAEGARENDCEEWGEVEDLHCLTGNSWVEGKGDEGAAGVQWYLNHERIHTKRYIMRTSIVCETSSTLPSPADVDHYCLRAMILYPSLANTNWSIDVGLT
jgi:hypothetical protein